MGLLGAFDDDQGRFALGLLAAAGPRADGAGFGQRLQEAMLGVQAGRDADLKRKFMQAQMDNYGSEIEQRKAAIAKQQKLQAMAERLLGGQQPAQGGTALVNDALPPELRIGAQAAIPARNGLGAASLEDIMAFQMAGGPDLLNAYKYAQEGTERKPGSEYILPNGQRRFGPPSVDKGMQLMPQPGGGYSAGLVPGVLDASNALAAGNTNAAEGAKAAFDLVSVPDGAGGTIQMPRSLAVQRFGQPNQANNPLRPSGPPLGMGGGSPSPQDLAVIQGDLQRNGVDRTDPRAPFVNFGQAGGGQLGRTPSAADLEVDKQRKLAPGVKQQVADDAEVKAAQAREDQRLRDQKQYLQMRAGVSQAIDLLGQKPTSSGIGAGVDSALGMFGKSTSGGTLAASLDTLSGWLTANVPRMEGPQSDRDVMNYRIMAGALGDRTKPIEQRMAAAKQLQSMQDKYAQLNGYADQPKDGASAPSAPSAPGAPPTGGKTATLADIAATAKSSGKSTAEVTKRMKELGYTIVGGQP